MTNEELTKELVITSRFLRGFRNRPRGQERILKALEKEGALYQQDIQQYLQVTPGTISEMISKLENKGLVERKRNEEDRRAVEISLTEKGRESISKLENEAEDDLYEALSDEEKEKLYEILVKLNNSLMRKIPLEAREHKRMPHREGKPEGRNFEGRFRFVGREEKPEDRRILRKRRTIL